jgi:hypothetical protein
MPAKLYEAIKVRIAPTFIDRRDWVKYLVLVNWHGRELGDILTRAPDAAFTKFVEKEVQSYLKGNKPAPEIQTPIMNIADDFLAGGEFVLKAGDYIALQENYRAKR